MKVPSSFMKWTHVKDFSEFRNQLKNILFHEKLGTILDKMIRVEKMVLKLNFLLEINEDTHQIVQDAAALALSDLATAVVTEFTSLSGIMGGPYALRDGYSEQIAEALFEITLPRFSGDMLPARDSGIVLAISYRLDSLVGLFAAGCQRSSTNYPFSLRRISYGLVQLLVEKNKNPDFKEALKLAVDVQPIKVDPDTIDDVDKGVSAEIVRSVLAERANFPCLAAKSAYKMEELSRGDLFPKVVEVYSPPTRIVRGKEDELHAEVDEAAFETDEERVLWSTLLSVKKRINPDLEIDDFVQISSKLIQSFEEFFNHVFVIVDDADIRKNRRSLLKETAELPRGIADLTLVPGF